MSYRLPDTDERGGLLRCRGCGGYRPDGNTCVCEMGALRAELADAQRNAAQAVARVRELEGEKAELQRQLTFQSARNHERNVELDALHYVWSNGGCRGGVHRWTDDFITEELVAAGERQVRRLRDWLTNKANRDARLTASATGSKAASSERAMAEALIKESAAVIRDLFADPEVARVLSRDDWGKSLKDTLAGLEEWLTPGAAGEETARG